MKTNQERAKIILSNASSTPEPEPKLASVSNRPVRQKLSWKMITALSVASVVFLGAIAGLIAGIIVGQRFNLNNMFITNFANYRAIGVGSTSNDDEALALASWGLNDTVVPKGSVLVGVGADNSIEELKYSKNPNSKSGKKLPNNLVEFRTCKNYSFATFILNGVWGGTRIGKGATFENFDYLKTYLIDNKTGKFYSLAKLGEGVFRYTPYTSYFTPECYPENCESDDAVYFYNEGIGSDSVLHINTIFKAHTKDNVLLIEEVFNALELNISNFFVDKYGNLFLTSDTDNKDGSHTIAQYLYKADTTAETRFIKFPSSTFKRCVNSVAYGTVDGKLKEVDEHGNLVDTTFEFSNIQFSDQYLIKSTETEDYYYLSNQNEYNKLGKITWLDEEHKDFKYEEIPLETEITQLPKFVTTKDHLYISSQNKIYKIEIATGKTEPLSEGYTFTSIEADNLGNVKFQGYNSNAEKVIGLIDNDGKVTIITEAPKYQIYYIKPLF